MFELFKHMIPQQKISEPVKSDNHLLQSTPYQTNRNIKEQESDIFAQHNITSFANPSFTSNNYSRFDCKSEMLPENKSAPLLDHSLFMKVFLVKLSQSKSVSQTSILSRAQSIQC